MAILVVIFVGGVPLLFIAALAMLTTRPLLAASLGVTAPEPLMVLTIGVATVALALAAVFVLRRWFIGRMRRYYGRWAAEQGRSAHERAAAAFYCAFGVGTRRRGEAVRRYLAALPAGASSAIIVGKAAVEPVDDGTLSEECDAYEGRARHAPRWLLALLAVPLFMQLTAFLTLHQASAGFGLPPWGYVLGAVAVLNAVLLLLAFGVLRPPGSVALVTPRRLVHANLRGERRFTPDDSVVLLVGLNRSHVLMVYRNDGRVAALQYTSLQTPGFRHLINRWCMLKPVERGRAAASSQDQMPLPAAP